MNFLIRTIILLIAPFQYSSASALGEPQYFVAVDWLMIATVLGLLYLIFFTSYLRQKGENIATKEDIKAITEQVEAVKNSLLLFTQAKLNLHNEERESLINSWEKINHWHALLDHVWPSMTPVGSEVIGQLEDARLECNAAFAKASLFNNNHQWRIAHFTLSTSLAIFEREVTIVLLKNKQLQLKHAEWSINDSSEFAAICTSLRNFKDDEECKEIAVLIGRLRDIIHLHLNELANNSEEP